MANSESRASAFIDMIRSGRNWRCIVSDNGVGMDGAGRSTGLNIVDALVRSLKGRLIIRSGISGTRLTESFDTKAAIRELSKDPEFVEKLRDIVGLYVDPPAHAVVLSVDEKSQIQALDRTQP